MHKGTPFEMNGLICLSGGLDSSVLAYDLKSQGIKLDAISFYYGQTHKRELNSAVTISSLLGIGHKVIDFSAAIVPGASLLTGGQGTPVVINRNATMLSIAATYASGIGAETVYYCPTVEDYNQFPDCRPDFVSAFRS